VLNETGNGDCKYTIEILDEVSGGPVDASLFSIEQAVFVEASDEFDERVTISRPASLKIKPGKAEHVGEHLMILMLKTEGNDPLQVTFTVTVLG